MLRFLFLCLLALSTTTPLTSETFRNPRRIPTSDNPQRVRVADLNRDGLPDIIYGDFFARPASAAVARCVALFNRRN